MNNHYPLNRKEKQRWAKKASLMTFHTGKLVLLFFGVVLLSFGCAPTRVEVKYDPSRQENLLVYTLNDTRDDKKISLGNCNGVNVNAYPIGRPFMALNFDVIVRYASQKGIIQNVTYNDLTTENTEALKSIKTDNENYVLILYLHKFDYTLNVFVSNIEGFLVQANTGRVVWKNSDVTHRLSGFINRASGYVDDYTTTCQHYGKLLATLVNGHVNQFPKLTKFYVRTDKDVYNQGEMIKVHFSNAPGSDSDWICVVPAGSPDTDAGDVKYMAKGISQGSLVFDPPTPGKYEVRAYFNYYNRTSKASVRYPFSVLSSP